MRFNQARSFMRFSQATSANRFSRMKSGLPPKTAKLPEIARRLLRFESEIACRTGQVISIEAYLRAAQAYMLISMPTDTSTIFGAFQAISNLLGFWSRCCAMRK